MKRDELPWLLDVLLRIRPRRLRDRSGEAEREMLALRWRDARAVGASRSIGFVLREAGGLLRNGIRMSARPRGPRTTARVDMANEFRHAWRRLVHSPGFSLASIAMLGLGLGASAAVFTLLNAVVLRPLPFPDAARLVWLDHGAPGFGLDRHIGTTTWLSLHYAESSRLLEGIAFGQRNAATLTEADGPVEQLSVADVTLATAQVIGVEPLLGRWFTGGELNTVVLSEGLWKRRFGGDPSILGRRIRLSGADHRVVGVMPERFAIPSSATSLWRLADYTPSHADGGFNYFAIARMRPGTTLASVRAELQQLIATAAEAFGEQPHVARRVREGRIQALPQSLHEHVIGNHRATLWMLMGAVLLVLMTAWANVANLFIVRSDGRRRELAVRRALGAGQGETLRYFLAEALLLACAAGVLGALLAWSAVRVIGALPGVQLPRAEVIAFDGTSVLVTLGLSLLAGIALGLIPLMQRARAVASVLRDDSRSATAGRARLRFRAALMATQVALAMMLVTAAGLLLRSYANVRAADPGFAARDVLFFDIGLPQRSYPARDAAAAFHTRLLDRLAGLPDVERAAMASCVPLDGYCWGESLVAEGATAPADDGPVVSLRRVAPSYFDVLQQRIVSGRGLAPDEMRADVVVLGEEAARRLFPAGNAVGRRVTPGDGGPGSQWFTVVGVAADVATRSVMEVAPEPAVYLPIRDALDATVTLHRMMFMVRTSVEPSALLPAVRDVVRELDADVAVARVRTLGAVMRADRAAVTFGTLLLGIAGAVALLLGALGIYAVFSYVVGTRTTEIGVRLALGAGARDVAGLIIGQAALVTAIGGAVGLAAAILLTRTMSSLLFGVTPLDGGVFASATLLLLVVALAAATVPARRAWRMRPVEALRSM